MESVVDMQNTDFYRGKNILVTGHTGFKGAWLTTWLTMLGAQVHGFSLPPDTEPSLYSILGPGRMDESLADIRDFTTLRKYVEVTRPEIVIHLAAQSLVRRSYKDPLETYGTNVMGTVNLLEAIRQAGTTRVILVITTDKVYRNNEWVWSYRENDALGGHDPYSSSKACTELAAQSYYDSFLCDDGETVLATARAGNVIGGGDWCEDRIIPDCVRALQNKEPIRVRSPKSVRPWQHVLEALNGYLLLVKNLWQMGDTMSGAWNFGPSSENMATVENLVDLFLKEWGNGSWTDVSGGKNPHETTLLTLNSEKAQTYLRWRYVYDFKRSVEETASWYRKYFGGEKDMLAVTCGQIEDYMRAGR